MNPNELLCFMRFRESELAVGAGEDVALSDELSSSSLSLLMVSASKDGHFVA